MVLRSRKRKREREGRCEGRKFLIQTNPEAVALARKLRRRRPKGGQLSLREVSKQLAAESFLNERGKSCKICSKHVELSVNSHPAAGRRVGEPKSMTHRFLCTMKPVTHRFL